MVSLEAGLLRIPGKLVKTQTAGPTPGDSDPGVCISHRFPGGADAVVLSNIFGRRSKNTRLLCEPRGNISSFNYFYMANIEK